MTFKIPPYLLPRPPMDLDDNTVAAFDRLFDDAVASGPAIPIDYRLDAPRWQFICHIADTRNILVHGSQNPDIAEFEPRQPMDATEFGNQHAVYAASDGLWSMYFAILDRANHPMTLVNSAIRVAAGDGPGTPYYFFSITRSALERKAFAPGMLYFLPRDSFVQQPGEQVDGFTISVAHWASPKPVRPVARIAVRPEDFPLLAQMRGHDDETTFARARANPAGFPWVDE